MKHNNAMTIRWETLAKPLAVALLPLILVACGGEEYSDLKTYVAEVKSKPAGHIDPLPAIVPYETFSYPGTSLRNPFVKPLGKAALASAQRAREFQPEINRAKEKLEQFPLDSLRLVGNLEKDGQRWALIKTSDGILHRARVGEHLGQDNGKILRISEREIIVKEIVSDGLGGWTTRESTLKVTQ